MFPHFGCPIKELLLERRLQMISKLFPDLETAEHKLTADNQGRLVLGVNEVVNCQ
jgi:hypothetical protein